MNLFLISYIFTRVSILFSFLLTIIGSTTASTPSGIAIEPEVTLKVLLGFGASPGDSAVIDHVTCALPD